MYLRKSYLKAAEKKIAAKITVLEANRANLYAKKMVAKAEYRLERKQLNESILKITDELDVIADDMDYQAHQAQLWLERKHQEALGDRMVLDIPFALLREAEEQMGAWMAEGMDTGEQAEDRKVELLNHRVDFTGKLSDNPYVPAEEMAPPPPPRATTWRNKRGYRMLGDGGIAPPRGAINAGSASMGAIFLGIAQEINDSKDTV